MDLKPIIYLANTARANHRYFKKFQGFDFERPIMLQKSSHNDFFCQYVTKWGKIFKVLVIHTKSGAREKFENERRHPGSNKHVRATKSEAIWLKHQLSRWNTMTSP